jgi:hypothetical protein
MVSLAGATNYVFLAGFLDPNGLADDWSRMPKVSPNPLNPKSKDLSYDSALSPANIHPCARSTRAEEQSANQAN